MLDLTVTDNVKKWETLKTLVLDSVPSPATRRSYNLALDEFVTWYGCAPRPGFVTPSPESSADCNISQQASAHAVGTVGSLLQHSSLWLQLPVPARFRWQHSSATNNRTCRAGFRLRPHHPVISCTPLGRFLHSALDAACAIPSDVVTYVTTASAGRHRCGHSYRQSPENRSHQLHEILRATQKCLLN
jgi:hypothetical protein